MVFETFSTDKKAKCLGCNHILDHATVLEATESPEPGDYSLCIKCYAIGEFDKDLNIKPFDSKRIAEMMQNEHLAWVKLQGAKILLLELDKARQRKYN